jgi:hypothetical protein
MFFLTIIIPFESEMGFFYRPVFVRCAPKIALDTQWRQRQQQWREDFLILIFFQVNVIKHKHCIHYGAYVTQ